MNGLNLKHSLAVVQFPISKLLNVLVLISLLLSNFGQFPVEAKSSEAIPNPSTFTKLSQENPSIAEDVYNSPSFARPEPREAEHLSNDEQNIVVPDQSRTSISSTFASTVITGVLTCNGAATGVTCTNYGSYLDYNINIVVTGLTGGTTASDIFIGSYKRSTSGGYMGMMSDFVHSETSAWPQNTVLSLVAIHTFDAGGVNYPSFTSGAVSSQKIGEENEIEQILCGKKITR